MFRVHTQDPAERHRLEQDCLSREDCLLAPAGRSNSVAGLVQAITYQFFQEETPTLAQKVCDFAVETLGMGFSLTSLREIMAAIRRQSDLLKLYQNYMSELNCQLIVDGDKEDELRETAAEGNLEEWHKSNTRETFGTDHTEKTMHSEIAQLDNASLLRTSSSQFSQLLSHSYRPLSSRRDKPQSEELDSSQELQHFEKKGASVMGSDIYVLMRREMQEDLAREVNLHRSRSKIVEVEQYRYNRMIKDSHMKGKLKRRKK